MKIPLKGKYGNGKYVIVDDEDFSKVKDINWNLTKLGYPLKTTFETGKSHNERSAFTVYLHRLIIDCPKGMVVDHINQNKLDNRKENLRIATHGQNHLNQGLQKNNTSGFKGVTKMKELWEARIKFNQKTIHIGKFEDKKEAALAYNKKALELFGSFALLNKI